MFWLILFGIGFAVLMVLGVLISLGVISEAGDVVLEEREGLSLVHDHSDEDE